MDGEGTEQGGARGLMGRQRCAHGGDSNCVSGTPPPKKNKHLSQKEENIMCPVCTQAWERSGQAPEP